jgi:molybdate transport system substrate-binding protein
MMRKIGIMVVALLAPALLVACGQTGAQTPQRTLTVLGAASLTEAFQELAARFSAEHPDARVQFDFQGSATLAEQINQGRRADLFASADTKNMDKVAASVAGKPETLVTNRLTIAVPAGNPAHITSLADLAAPGRSVVLCAPQVPCGAAAGKVEQAGGVRVRPVSEEDDVKSVLRKVAAREADAGLVYVTDARSAGDKVQAVDFPEAQQAINSYPVATLRDAPEPELAAQFLAFVRGPVGRDVLTKYGFGTP